MKKIVKNKAVLRFLHGFLFMLMNVAILSALSLLIRGDQSFEQVITTIFVMVLGVFIIGNLLGGERNE